MVEYLTSTKPWVPPPVLHGGTFLQSPNWGDRGRKVKSSRSFQLHRKLEVSLSSVRLCHKSRNRPSATHSPGHQLQHHLPLGKVHQPSIVSDRHPSSPTSKDPRPEWSATKGWHWGGGCSSICMATRSSPTQHATDQTSDFPLENLLWS